MVPVLERTGWQTATPQTQAQAALLLHRNRNRTLQASEATEVVVEVVAAVAVRRRTTTLSSRTTTTTSRRTATTTIPTARSRVGAGRQSLTHSLTPSVCVLRLCCAVLVCLCQCQCLPACVCSSVEHERVFECPLLHDGGLASLSFHCPLSLHPSAGTFLRRRRCPVALARSRSPSVRSFVRRWLCTVRPSVPRLFSRLFSSTTSSSSPAAAVCRSQALLTNAFCLSSFSLPRSPS